MEYIINLYHNGTLIDPSDYRKIVVANKTVDRIVNEIYEEAAAGSRIKPVYNERAVG